MNEKCEYPEYFARFYDVIYHKLRTADIEYFRNKIRNTSGKVLEIGVGTGRFFIEALNDGADIYGIDLSRSMIQVLLNKLDRQHHFRVQNADACTMNLDQKFNLIIAPFRVFAHVLSIEDQLKFLNNVHKHLEDNGIFIFDLFVPNPEILYKGITNVTDFEGEYEPGKKLKRISTSLPDIVNQVLNVTMKFEWDENSSERREEWNFKLRLFFRYEIELLINHSKLKLLNMYGDYNESPLNKDSKEFVAVCGK